MVRVQLGGEQTERRKLAGMMKQPPTVRVPLLPSPQRHRTAHHIIHSCAPIDAYSRVPTPPRPRPSVRHSLSSAGSSLSLHPRMEEGRRTRGHPWRRGGRRENGTMTFSSLRILLFLPMERDFSRERNSGESDSAEGKKTGGRTGVHGVVRAPGARPPATPHR